MNLEELSKLRGLELARAYLREVIRCNAPPPPPVPHMNHMVYAVSWASTTWRNVRARYNARAAEMGLAQAGHIEVERVGWTEPARWTGRFSLIGEPNWSQTIEAPSGNDLYLLGALELYCRMVKAGVINPRDEPRG